MEELNDLLLQRRAKLTEFREQGVNPFANDFSVTHTSDQFLGAHVDDDAATLEGCSTPYAVAGRIMARRDFGKAAFIQLQDRSGRTQVYVGRDNIGEEADCKIIPGKLRVASENKDQQDGVYRLSMALQGGTAYVSLSQN